MACLSVCMSFLGGERRSNKAFAFALHLSCALCSAPRRHRLLCGGPQEPWPAEGAVRGPALGELPPLDHCRPRWVEGVWCTAGNASGVPQGMVPVYSRACFWCTGVNATLRKSNLCRNPVSDSSEDWEWIPKSRLLTCFGTILVHTHARLPGVMRVGASDAVRGAKSSAKELQYVVSHSDRYSFFFFAQTEEYGRLLFWADEPSCSSLNSVRKQWEGPVPSLMCGGGTP